MFRFGQPVFVYIPVNGQQIAVPGICNSDEFTGTRKSKVSNADIPTQLVSVITFHNVTAEQARDGQPKTYYKLQHQPAFFMDARYEAVPELDDLTGDQLAAKLRESRDNLTTRAAQNGGAPITTRLTAPVAIDPIAAA